MSTPVSARPHEPAGRGPTGSVPGRTAAAPRWAVVPVVVNLVAQVGIVVTGGAVRLTGSGLGCPTWPQCEVGSYTPVYSSAMGVHADIEFANRLLTFVVGLAAVAALAAVARLVVTGRREARLLPWAAAPLVGVVVQAGIGGVTVLLSLHPVTVATHFLVSMGLVAASTTLLVRLRERSDGPTRLVVGTPARRLTQATGVVVGAVLVLGTLVTGAGPHSGDAEHPARLAFDTQVISRVHADAVVLLLVALLALVVLQQRTSAPARPRRRAVVLLAVVLAQGLVGWVQYVTDLPEVLVGVHMLGAALVVVATTALLLAQRTRAPRTADPLPADDREHTPQQV
ncbi:COX15/CtaA family protein [Pseudokineococcus basanitobsidens]|uniref:COX15/CtaA family protein n=1 Tax=Pseudokineococcus basanitobsidens TaxID=1926649 RepID=A0ABU8RLR8_9ACTN